MLHLQRKARVLLAIVATASMPLASADVIDSYQPYVTTNASTHTDIVAGADVSHLFAYDTSSLDMSGGEVSHLTMNDATRLTLSAGAIGHLILNGSPALTLSGGSVSHVTLNGSAAATVSGGDISFLRIFEDSTAAISGPLTLSWLIVGETSRVDIHVIDATYSGGQLTGTWQDGTPFQFWTLIGSPGMPGTAPAELPPNIKIHSAASEPSAP